MADEQSSDGAAAKSRARKRKKMELVAQGAGNTHF